MSGEQQSSVFDDAFWDDPFHLCAMAASFIAQAEGKFEDSEYVRQLAYEFFEDGAFRDRVRKKPPEGWCPSD
jgi:hypothetical protein